jgi:precorrin-2/cobalt-factor-2 C20-methyltransferase
MSKHESQIGCLYGISAGPGDPELISVKGLKRLQASSVVAFPAGVRSPIGVAQRIISPWLEPHQTLLSLEFPMVENVEEWRSAWQVAATQTWAYLSQGKDVAFVSEGDVSFYSTYSYLAHVLKAQHPELVTTAIPGVCSPLASVAALGIPLTTLGDRLAVLPALYGLEELPTLITWANVLVLMKVGSVYPQIWDQLAALNLLKASALVIHASQSQEQIFSDLTHHRDLSPPYFSLIVVRINPESILSGVPLS